jgi:hypothetical protein
VSVHESRGFRLLVQKSVQEADHGLGHGLIEYPISKNPPKSREHDVKGSFRGALRRGDERPPHERGQGCRSCPSRSSHAFALLGLQLDGPLQCRLLLQLVSVP